MLQVPPGSLISSPAAHAEPPGGQGRPSEGGEAISYLPAESLGDDVITESSASRAKLLGQGGLL